jgi:tetratricopeptide (TPR) repeat protein
MLKQSLSNELIKRFNNYLDEIKKQKDSKNYTHAMELIDAAFKDIFRLGIKFFNSFTTDNLLDMINTNGSPNTDKCIMMSKLLEEEGDVLEKQNKSNEAFYINQRCLNVFIDTYMNKSDHYTLGSYFNDIETLIDNLMEYELPISLENKIRDYYACEGKYDKADNIAYCILEDSNYDRACVEDALAFYEKLLKESKSSLKSGGISKSEIKETIEEIKSKI